MAAGGIYRFPLLEIAEHLVRRIRVVRKLQWQAAGAVGAQLQHADVVEGAAFQIRPELAGLGRQVEFTGRQGVTGEGGGEGFAHRADFEQGVFADFLSGVFAGDAVVKVMRLAVDGQRYGEAGNVLLLHHRRHRCVDQR
ncbi:hypothetical protein D3C81_1365030 [compost metagenome]